MVEHVSTGTTRSSAFVHPDTAENFVMLNKILAIPRHALTVVNVKREFMMTMNASVQPAIRDGIVKLISVSI